MCLRDLLTRLQREGLTVTEAQVRWAVRTGKVSRPTLDGSLRFNYGDEHVRALMEYFKTKSCRSDGSIDGRVRGKKGNGEDKT